MDGTEKRTALLKAAVHSVANNGLENTTTRTIGTEAGIHDAYIYRYFDDKDQLLAQAYLTENEKIMNVLVKAIDYENQFLATQPLEQRSAYVICAAWKYLTDNPDICKFLVYYYNSPGFSKYALEDHRKWVSRLTQMLYPTFHTKEEPATMLYMIFNSLYEFAMQVANGILPNTEETAQRVFRNVYTAISACCENKHRHGA